jgi:hypothetical protein
LTAKTAAAERFRHGWVPAYNSLIGNQFPDFRGAASRCVIAATAAVFLHKFAPFLHFLRRPLLSVV